MGADLYIESISEKQNAKYEPLFKAAVKARNDLANAFPQAQPYMKDVWRSGPTPRPPAALREKVKLLNDAQKEVDKYYKAMQGGGGYFRDSYNSWGLSSLGYFSWWQDVVPMLRHEDGTPCPLREDKEAECPLDGDEHSPSYLHPEQAKELLKKLDFEVDLKQVIERKLKETTYQIQTAEMYQKEFEKNSAYFKSRHKTLVAFLKRAIKMKEPIYCSL